MSIHKKIRSIWAQTSSGRFVQWLRKQGVKVGDQVVFHQRKNVTIDLTRPCLVEIGNNVHFTQGLTILTHGYDWVVLRNLYQEVIASSGKVTIGNNVFVGYNVTILKGVTIGDNSIIGAGSVVTRSIPANSVAAGNPARLICTIEAYYQKRRARYIEEAKDYARCIQSRYRRRPVPADFWEEFPLFLDGNKPCDDIDIQKQLGDSFAHHVHNHKSVYHDFPAFLNDCGL
jgi:acetyltransferase-like isoleucine patch superfamily enzyme